MPDYSRAGSLMPEEYREFYIETLKIFMETYMDLAQPPSCWESEENCKQHRKLIDQSNENFREFIRNLCWAYLNEKVDFSKVY